MFLADVRVLLTGGITTVLAVDAPSAESGFGAFANYGAIGIFAGLLVVFARTAYKREADRSDRHEAALIKLYDTTVERIGPAFEQAARAVEASTNLINEVRAERALERELQQRVDSMRERLEGGRP